MNELTDADRIWNRATLEKGGSTPRVGDSALAVLLQVHGVIMNGGVLHAIEVFSDEELDRARDGFRFFGLDEVSTLINEARRTVPRHRIAQGEYEEHLEKQLGERYWSFTSDESIAQRFEGHYRNRSGDFAPP